MEINFNIKMNQTITFNYAIEVKVNPSTIKRFDILNNESLEIGFDKNKIYNINTKNLENNFSLFKINDKLVQGINSYIDQNKLTIDFTKNIPQRNIKASSPENEIAYITYRLDNTNSNKLKAFTLDLFNFETGLVSTSRELPQIFYLGYTGDKYNKPCYPFVEFEKFNFCTDIFVCSICNAGRGIYVEKGPGATMIVPRDLLPFNIYGRESEDNPGNPYVDYDFDYNVPGNYRIFLNNNFFRSCCCGDPVKLCKPQRETVEESFCNEFDIYDLNYLKRIKKTDLIVNGVQLSIADRLEDQFGILFLDNMFFSKIKDAYLLNYSGQINNTNSFIEGDEITIRQYYYPYEECFSKIFYKEPDYPEIDKKFIYSTSKSGEDYFSNQNELIEKINLTYNSSGIYSWIPLAYKENPDYDFGPLLLAEQIDNNNISIKSLKSGLLGKHLIGFKGGQERKGFATTWMVPKNIKLQGSNNLIDWEDIIDSSFDRSLNEVEKNIPFGGKIPYDNAEAIKDTEVTKIIKLEE